MTVRVIDRDGSEVARCATRELAIEMMRLLPNLDRAVDDDDRVVALRGRNDARAQAERAEKAKSGTPRERWWFQDQVDNRVLGVEHNAVAPNDEEE